MVSHSVDVPNALLGGGLIGLAAALLFVSSGRIAGISGLLGDLLQPSRWAQSGWRLAFLLGLPLGAAWVAHWVSAAAQVELQGRWPSLLLAGLLVGVGTRLGGGCTSGHGICGMARLAPRSIVATLTFMVTAIITAALLRLLEVR